MRGMKQPGHDGDKLKTAHNSANYWVKYEFSFCDFSIGFYRNLFWNVFVKISFPCSHFALAEFNRWQFYYTITSI